MQIKFQVLSLLNASNNNNNNTNSYPAAPPPPPQEKDIELTEDNLQLARDIITSIQSKGLYINDEFLDKATIEAVAHDIKQVELKPAGIGTGVAKVIDVKARGDMHAFIRQDSVSKNLAFVIEKIERIKHAINKEYGAKLTQNSVQVALYPGDGARYVKHSDSSLLLCPKRRLTAILYFNDRATCSGGTLRVFTKERATQKQQQQQQQPTRGHDDANDANDDDTSGIIHVEPYLNRFIVFTSDTYHEVLPSYSMRYAMTVWLYGDRDIYEILGKPSYNIGSLGTTATATTATSTKKEKPSALLLLGDGVGSSISSTDNDNVDDEEETIFVSICAYRDPECQHTVRDLFEKSSHPDRIVVGICWQYDKENDRATCFTHTDYGPRRSKQVREIHMSHTAAKGPCYARYLIQSKLYRDETYYLQIDSHMRFEKGWDTTLIEMLHQCEETDHLGKCIITAYPPGYELPNEIPRNALPTLLCAKEFIADDTTDNSSNNNNNNNNNNEQQQQQQQNSKDLSKHMLRIRGRVMISPTLLERPVPSLFYAAGFHFSRGFAIKEVPYDPNLQYVFFGEEMDLCARFYTHGYNFYAPHRVVLYHLWKRSYRPTFWNDASNCSSSINNNNNNHDTAQEQEQRPLTTAAEVIDLDASSGETEEDNAETKAAKKQRGLCKILRLLGMQRYINSSNNDDDDADRYGLGTVRSLQQFEEFCGVSFADKKISIRARNGGLDDAITLI